MRDPSLTLKYVIMYQNKITIEVVVFCFCLPTFQSSCVSFLSSDWPMRGCCCPVVANERAGCLSPAWLMWYVGANQSSGPHSALGSQKLLHYRGVTATHLYLYKPSPEPGQESYRRGSGNIQWTMSCMMLSRMTTSETMTFRMTMSAMLMFRMTMSETITSRMTMSVCYADV